MTWVQVGCRDWRLRDDLHDWVATELMTCLKNHWDMESDALNRMVEIIEIQSNKKCFDVLKISHTNLCSVAIQEVDIALRLVRKVRFALPRKGLAEAARPRTLPRA